MPHARVPSSLTDQELDVLAAAYLPGKGLFWLPNLDQFYVSEGWRTRQGRSMRGAGYIRVRNGAVAWLPYVAGAGRHKTDEPARLMEITPKGVEALEKRMGPDSFRQLVALAQEQREKGLRR